MSRNRSGGSSPVLIVGGGASGLSAAGALHRRGIGSVVLEQDDEIGGSWTRRYDRLRLHTIRQYSGLAHFPIPARHPRYLTRDEYAGYLREYAAHFPLHVVTGCRVSRIEASPATPGAWTVDSSAGEWHGDAVVVATGHFHHPCIPSWPGRDVFRGTVIHSSRYANAAPFTGQRVLVVGAGNSGTEIATDLAGHGAAQVALSVRTPPPVVPRDPFGLPVQRTGILLSHLPAAVADRIARLTARIVIGDLTPYGFPPAAWMPYSASRIPVIDVGFVAALKARRIAIRRAVARLTATGAVFDDGRHEPFDAIIAATGFTTGLDELLDPAGVLDAAGEPLSGSGEPSSRPGLYFIGFVHTLRGHLFEANRASRRLAAHITAYLSRSVESAHTS